jgi:hypothetical protein
MSWFRRIPHPPEQTRRMPHHAGPMADELREEIERNRQQLEEHRQQVKRTQQEGKQ